MVGQSAPGRLQRPDWGVRRNVQDVLHPLCRQTVSEPRGHPERVVPRSPPGAEAPPCPGLAQHLQGQAGLRPVPPLGLWHARRRTAGWIRGPALRQIQALVHQGPPARPHVGQKHPGLAISHLPQGPTVLPGHPHGLDPLFGEITAVEHPDRQWMLQPGTKILLQAGNDRIIIPARLGEKSLERPGRDRHHLGQILGVAPLLGLDQQGLEIMPAVLPPLFAAEGRGKEGMKVTESLVNPLKRVHFHPTPLSPFTTLRKYLTLQSVVVILAGCGKTLLSTQGRKPSDDKRRPIACSERIIRIGLSHAECRRDS